MNKKLLIISSSVMASPFILASATGITYEVRWSQFKKNFAKDMVKLAKKQNDIIPGSFTYKLDDSIYVHHIVDYVVINNQIYSEYSVQYQPFGGFKDSNVNKVKYCVI